MSNCLNFQRKIFEFSSFSSSICLSQHKISSIVYIKWFWNLSLVGRILKELSSLKRDTRFWYQWKDWPEEKEDDFDPADDGEPTEETHGASDETQLGLRLDLLVSLDVVEGRRVKVDLHQLKGRMI